MVSPRPTMPEPASRMRRRSVASSKTSTPGVLQPWPMDVEVAYGTAPRTPRHRTRMRVAAYYAPKGAARRRGASGSCNVRHDFIRPDALDVFMNVRHHHQL